MKPLRIYFLLVCLFINSCSQKEIMEEPESVGGDRLELALEEQQIVAFKSIEKRKKDILLDESQIDEYFSTRVASFMPVKIIIDEDSTVLIKSNGLIESLKSNWESEKLFVQNDQQGVKKLLGEKKETGFLLHCAFFTNKVIQNDRFYQSLGQYYGLSDYSSLVEDAQDYQLIWLQIESFYN